MTFPESDKDPNEVVDLVEPAVEPDSAENQDENEEPEPFIGFADEEEEDESEQTPLVQRLRSEIRERDRKLAKLARAPETDDDPEPHVSDEPGSIEDFDYDSDRLRAAWQKHKEDLTAHAEWKVRQKGKEATREAEQIQTVKRVQQQAAQLGVKDFDAREARVREALSPIQLKAIVQYADNPAAMIAALGGSQTKLDELSSVSDPARFMMKLQDLQRGLKMGKKKPPEPETRVHGGNANLAAVTDKEEERLEREAARTGDRSKVIAYRRERRNAA